MLMSNENVTFLCTLFTIIAVWSVLMIGTGLWIGKHNYGKSCNETVNIQ